MSSSTSPVDLADLRTAFYNRMRDKTTTALDAIVDQFLNVGLVDMHINPITYPYWAERRATLITHAPYSTGTVSIAAAARTTVTGASTAWNTAVTGFGFNNARAGGKIKFGGVNEVYEVSAVGSDTALTLATNYTGDAITDGDYTYFEDEYALASDFLKPADMRLFSGDWKISLIGRQDFRRRYVRNDTAGKPTVATLIQLEFSGSTTARPRVVLHPYPSDEMSIPYSYITTNLAVSSAGAVQTQMTATSDEPILPFRYRMGIVYNAIYHYYRDRKDDTRSQEAKAEYVDFMSRMANDAGIGQQDRPRFYGPMRKFGPGRSTQGRYQDSSDDRFDSIRDRY
jgi:hypothetical protein